MNLINKPAFWVLLVFCAPVWLLLTAALLWLVPIFLLVAVPIYYRQGRDLFEAFKYTLLHLVAIALLWFGFLFVEPEDLLD